MSEQQQQLDALSNWLMANVNKSIAIRKEEAGDVDQARITLEKIFYMPGNASSDDYVEEDRIVLYGEGQIDPEGQGEEVPLPRKSYEIPLSHQYSAVMQPEGLQLVTERAVYQLSSHQ